MNSNSCASIRPGVTYAEYCGICLLRLLIFSVLLSFGASYPAVDRYNYSGITPINSGTNDKMSFLRTKSNKILVINADGAVEGSPCENKYGLLRFGSHMPRGQTDKAMTTIYGVAAEKFLCVMPNGTVYSVGMDKFSEDDCGFIEKIKHEQSGTIEKPTIYSYTKYRHYKHGARTAQRIRKYHIALGCKNKAITISRRWEREYYENDTLFIVEATSARLDKLNETCGDNSKLSTRNCKRKPRRKKCSELVKPAKGQKRTYVKFCRKVYDNFFSATLRDLRLFHKRDCWDVLRRYKRCKQRRREKKEEERKLRKRSLVKEIFSLKTS